MVCFIHKRHNCKFSHILLQVTTSSEPYPYTVIISMVKWKYSCLSNHAIELNALLTCLFKIFLLLNLTLQNTTSFCLCVFSESFSKRTTHNVVYYSVTDCKFFLFLLKLLYTFQHKVDIVYYNLMTTPKPNSISVFGKSLIVIRNQIIPWNTEIRSIIVGGLL